MVLKHPANAEEDDKGKKKRKKKSGFVNSAEDLLASQSSFGPMERGTGNRVGTERKTSYRSEGEDTLGDGTSSKFYVGKHVQECRTLDALKHHMRGQIDFV